MDPQSLWQQCFTWLVEQAWPPVCLVCGGAGSAGMDICRACALELPHAQAGACTRCALPLPHAGSGTLCGQCLSSPPAFDQILAAFHYQPPIDHLVSGFKFRARLNQGRLLGELMQQSLIDRIEPPDLILPVPLHPSRLRQRGFNQAVELARPLARTLRLPLELHAVRRIRATPPQRKLSSADRQKNLRHAFEPDPDFKPAHVALVDDVMTTGATISELARLLKRHGVLRVDAWVLARVPA